MLITICAGYRDAAGHVHPCNKVLSTQPSERDEISHGVCAGCYEITLADFRRSQGLLKAVHHMAEAEEDGDGAVCGGSF